MVITVYICCSRLSKLISHATLCLLSSSPYFGVCGPEVHLPFRLPEVYFGPLRSLQSPKQISISSGFSVTKSHLTQDFEKAVADCCAQSVDCFRERRSSMIPWSITGPFPCTRHSSAFSPETRAISACENSPCISTHGIGGDGTNSAGTP